MAQIVCCDRCHATNVQVVQVLGKDLCNGCIHDFKGWVELGVRKRRRARGDWARVFCEIQSRDGVISQKALGKHAGLSAVRANEIIQRYRHLNQLRRIGDAAYVLVEQQAAE